MGCSHIERVNDDRGLSRPAAPRLRPQASSAKPKKVRPDRDKAPIGLNVFGLGPRYRKPRPSPKDSTQLRRFCEICSCVPLFTVYNPVDVFPYMHEVLLQRTSILTISRVFSLSDLRIITACSVPQLCNIWASHGRKEVVVLAAPL